MSKNVTLILSRLAGRIDVDCSPSDSADEMIAKIEKRLDESSGTLTLSEREVDLVLSNRELQIDALENASVAQKNFLKQEFANREIDLCLSQGSDDAFDALIEFAKLAPKVQLPTKDKTGAQVLSLDNPDAWKPEPNGLQEDAKRRAEAAKQSA